MANSLSDRIGVVRVEIHAHNPDTGLSLCGIPPMKNTDTTHSETYDYNKPAPTAPFVEKGDVVVEIACTSCFRLLLAKLDERNRG